MFKQFVALITNLIFARFIKFIVANKFHKPSTSYIRTEISGNASETKVSIYFKDNDEAIRFYNSCILILKK